jgi:hypothetical protein
MLNVWTLRSGSSLGSISERIRFEQVLPTHPLTGELAGVTFSVISGKLPGGLRILNNKITGTPFEVNAVTEFKFVIRAKLGSQISDRTFLLTVEGPDDPIWVTPEGRLSVNTNGQAFVLDSTYINFNLRAVDSDIRAGDKLEFFIQNGDGQLPPGLTLSSDGNISGKIDPIITLNASAGDGFFDTNLFDSNPFDFGLSLRGGIERFAYDEGVYDFIESLRAPRKLNRNYEFFVSVTDGSSVIRRRFIIFVVGDDFLRADNTILQVGDGSFTADVTYFRGAFWLSGSNLGIKRANNYVTLLLDAFDPRPDVGPLVYELASVNSDNTPSVLPEGLFLDNTTGEVFGFIPYQTAITIDYQFTINAIKYDAASLFNEIEVAVVVGTNASYGQNYLLINPLPSSDVDLIVNEFLRIGNYQYKVVSYTSQTVIGGVYALLRLDVPLKIDVPKTDTQGNPTVFTKRFLQSTLEYGTIVSPKTFNLTVLGEVDSVIKFITPKDIGSIRANFTSTLSVIAETNVPNAVLSYQLLSTNSDGSVSKLPAGLTLNASGEIIGKAQQFGDDVSYVGSWKSSTYASGRTYNLNDVVTYNGLKYKCIIAHVVGTSFNNLQWQLYEVEDLGLTLFDNGATTFDGATANFDRSYKFSVLAADQFKYSAVVGEFTLKIQESTDRLYSNIFAQPYQKIEKRTYFSNFINDTGIFDPSKIYRLNDPGFGVQKDLRMLVYAGIETRSISEYVPFLNRNIKRKRFKMGDVKTAVAKEQGSNNIVYEIVYIEVIDEYEINKKSTDLRIKLPNNRNALALVNQARSTAAIGDLSTPENQAKLNRDEVDRFRPVKDPYTADNTAVLASGRDQEYAYPSSLINIRKNLRNLSIDNEDGSTIRAIAIENEFLPLWMKTSQNSRTAATGFINAIPLCYCKPGQGQYILDNIKNSDFDIGLIDYEIDRFMIDSTTGNSEIQVLKFTNYRYNV